MEGISFMECSLLYLHIYVIRANISIRNNRDMASYP